MLVVAVGRSNPEIHAPDTRIRVHSIAVRRYCAALPGGVIADKEPVVGSTRAGEAWTCLK